MAANQSRRRTGLEGTNEPMPADPTTDFQYQPLKPDVDGIRLLQIDPAASVKDPIVCSLSNVEFRERPKYEALSYMWGKECPQSPIIINGCKFMVRQNLLDALHYLRSQGRKLPIWIDALCINQEEIVERNKQLRIMHHIYLRATTVLVWLGASYKKYQDLLARHWTSAEHNVSKACISGTAESSNTVTSDEEKTLAESLDKDEYWQRLWIIQEIGKAERILVCLGSSFPIKWDDLVHFLEMQNLGDDGPLRLDKLRKGANKGARTIRRLLLDHQHASCEKRHDKVYALVGLAVDAFGFPMDYTKTLIEVWRDVMHFVNDKQLVVGEELVRFGAVVKSLVMPIDYSPLEHILRPYHVTEDDDGTASSISASHTTFKVRGVVLGQICHIGASIGQIVSNLSTVDRWNEDVQENFRDDVEAAQDESADLQRAIIEQSPLRTCFNHVCYVHWTAEQSSNDRARANKHKGADALWYYDFFYPNNDELEEVSRGPDNESFHNELRLYQLQKLPLTPQSWKMGILSSQARPADFIVWIPDTRQAAVVRRKAINNYLVRLQVVGTALITDDVAKVPSSHTQRVSEFAKKTRLCLQMDADTIFVLLAYDNGENLG